MTATIAHNNRCVSFLFHDFLKNIAIKLDHIAIRGYMLDYWPRFLYFNFGTSHNIAKLESLQDKYLSMLYENIRLILLKYKFYIIYNINSSMLFGTIFGMLLIKLFCSKINLFLMVSMQTIGFSIEIRTIG